MNKSQALEYLGGSVTAAAAAIGITPQAVTQWPEELPPRISDRVYAAMARKQDQSPADSDQSPAVIDLKKSARDRRDKKRRDAAERREGNRRDGQGVANV